MRTARRGMGVRQQRGGVAASMGGWWMQSLHRQRWKRAIRLGAGKHSGLRGGVGEATWAGPQPIKQAPESGRTAGCKHFLRTCYRLDVRSEVLVSGWCLYSERAPQQRAHATPDITCTTLDVARTASRFPHASHVQHPDLLLKHLVATIAIYKRRQIKHLKQVSETLAKTPKNT
jgi:hypothetical protein